MKKKERHQVIIEIGEDIHMRLKIFCINNKKTIRGLVKELLIKEINKDK